MKYLRCGSTIRAASAECDSSLSIRMLLSWLLPLGTIFIACFRAWLIWVVGARRASWYVQE